MDINCAQHVSPEGSRLFCASDLRNILKRWPDFCGQDLSGPFLGSSRTGIHREDRKVAKKRAICSIYIDYSRDSGNINILSRP